MSFIIFEMGAILQPPQGFYGEQIRYCMSNAQPVLTHNKNPVKVLLFL